MSNLDGGRNDEMAGCVRAQAALPYSQRNILLQQKRAVPARDSGPQTGTKKATRPAGCMETGRFPWIRPYRVQQYRRLPGGFSFLFILLRIDIDKIVSSCFRVKIGEMKDVTVPGLRGDINMASDL